MLDLPIDHKNMFIILDDIGIEIFSIPKHQFLDGITLDFKAFRLIHAPHHTVPALLVFRGDYSFHQNTQKNKMEKEV